METAGSSDFKIQLVHAPPQEHMNIIPPTPETAPGLDSLEPLDKVFIAKVNSSLPFRTADPMLSHHYQIIDQKGQHIYTLCQANTKAIDKLFSMQLFTVDGHLILSIIQRWNLVQDDQQNLDEILPYLQKDQQLPTLVVQQEGAVLKRHITMYQVKEDDPDAQVHIRHSNGDFLGHLWKGVDCWIIHDTNLLPKYTFPKISTNSQTSQYTQNAKHKLQFCCKPYSYLEYYPSHGLEATCEGEPLGFIETEINTQKFGFLINSKHCSCAHFPIALGQVDKLLITTMALSQYCRVHTTAEKTGCLCFWFCVILSLMFCVLCIFGVVVAVCVGTLENSCRSVAWITGAVTPSGH